MSMGRRHSDKEKFRSNLNRPDCWKMSEQALKTLRKSGDFQAEYTLALSQMATISECRYRWLRVRNLNLTFDKFLSLGGRSEEISQIWVVCGKAVALT
jgi:hypothetical protein